MERIEGRKVVLHTAKSGKKSSFQMFFLPKEFFGDLQEDPVAEGSPLTN